MILYWCPCLHSIAVCGWLLCHQNARPGRSNVDPFLLRFPDWHSVGNQQGRMQDSYEFVFVARNCTCTPWFNYELSK